MGGLATECVHCGFAVSQSSLYCPACREEAVVIDCGGSALDYF